MILFFRSTTYGGVKIKILLITPSFVPDFTGMANTTYEKYRWLKNKGIDVKVLAFTPRYSDPSRINAKFISDDIIRYMPLSRKGKYGFFFRIVEILNLFFLIIKNYSDREIIQTMGWSTLNIGLLMAKPFLKAKKYVMVFRGNDGWEYDPNKILTLRKFQANSSYVVSNSQALADHLASKRIKVDLVVWSEVDTDKFFPTKKKNGCLNLITVKGLYPVGGADIAIDALGYLNKSGIDFKMTFIGDGPLKNTLLKQAKNLGIADKIRFLGNIEHDKIPNLLNESDIFILSSNRESSPHVIAEAMAVSMPIVATAVKGTEEFIKDGQTGLLSPIGDAKAFAENIKRFIKNPDLRKKCAENAYEFAKKNISHEICFRKYLTLYENLMSTN